MNRSAQGFTLIELLIAMAVFAVGLVLLLNLTSVLKLNGSNMSTLTASQAVQDALERTARAFQTGTYGKITAAEAPLDLAGYTWTVNVCAVVPPTDTCTGSTTFIKTSYAAPTVYTAATTTKLLRVTVAYTPTDTQRARPVSAALEMGRP